MPCLEISVPNMDDRTRRALASELTDVFVDTTGFDREIFGIRFQEYGWNEAASGGSLIDASTVRPYLHFLLYCPRISRANKQKLVREFTAAYTHCVGRPDWQPVIHICEHPYDNVGVGGELLSDAYPELADSKFYYEISDD